MAGWAVGNQGPAAAVSEAKSVFLVSALQAPSDRGGLPPIKRCTQVLLNNHIHTQTHTQTQIHT